MRIDQLLVSAAPGDAVTDLARTLRGLLSAHVQSEIYALFFDSRLAGDVRPLEAYAKRSGARSAQDVLVFHLSIGESEVADFVRRRLERLVLVYHNISPSEPFRIYDPGFADLLDEGRAELLALRERTAAAFTVSEFNAGELRAAGYRNIEVLPLVVDAGALRATESDATIVHRVGADKSWPLILSVGQLLPHKRPDFLIEAFHILSTYLIPEAGLVIVGPERLPEYRAVLETQVDELGLERAWLTGAVSQHELAALFQRADVFATASEHEGFCVPLIEAMAFDLPFLARRFAAIPETAGPAGLLIDQTDGPAVAAEALATLLGDSSLRDSLVAKGRSRLADFDAELAKTSWRDALLALT